MIAFDGDASVARARGCLMIEGFEPPTDDPFIRQELIETLYHVLWELVHVFIEHRERRGHDAGASSFLYPFLGESAQALRERGGGRAALDRSPRRRRSARCASRR